MPGRLDVVAHDPLVIHDGAHNPAGAEALADSLPAVIGGRRPLVGVVSVLDDKDAAAMLTALLPACDRVVFTRCANPRSLSPATLDSLARKLDGPPAETVPEPVAAVGRARELAGPGGAVVATGSIYRSPTSCASRARPGVHALRGSGGDGRSRRSQLSRDDRPGGARRRHRDPGLLRDRVRARAAISVTSAGTLARSMAYLAVFGITNDGLNLAVNLLLLFLVVLWFALIYWTYAHARRRIADPMLVGCATAASFFPFVGTIVYLIVRPPEYLEDMRERELEIAAAEARLASLEHEACPYCGFEVERKLPALPELPAAARQELVRHLRKAARPALEAVPLLRGGDRPGSAAPLRAGGVPRASPPRAPPTDRPPPSASRRGRQPGRQSAG